MKSRTAGLKKFLCILCCGPVFASQAGSIRLFSGESHTGKVALANGEVAVTWEHSNATFNLSDIVIAYFGDHTAADNASLPPGAVLPNGTFVVGMPSLFNDSTVKLGTQEKPGLLPFSAVSAIVFSTTPRTRIYRSLSGKTGAILPFGDFFEGTFTGVRQNAVVINSPLFGPHAFAVTNEISALVFRGIQTGATRYEIGAKNGARYLSNDVKAEHDGVFISDPVMGSVKIDSADLVDIRAGVGRYQLLTDLKPVSVIAASGTKTRGVISTSDEGDGAKTLSTGANVAVTYPVPAGQTVFSCSVAIQKDTPAGSPATTGSTGNELKPVPKFDPPAGRVTFAVYGDGKLFYRSMQTGPADAPQALRVSLGAAQQITLRVEPATPGAEALAGSWIEPILFHP